MPYTQCLEREVEADCKNEFCFRPFTLETKELIESYTKPWKMDCSDLSFANLFIWGTEGKMQFAEKNNVLYVKLDFEGVPVYFWAPIPKKGADVDYRKAIMDAADYMKQAGVEFILVDYWRRYPKKAFDKWDRSQKRYRNTEDREKVRDIVESSMAMPEMARLLGVPRSTVYGLLNQSEILKTIEFDGRRRVTKKSFYEWYGSQNDYHIVSDEMPETVKDEDNRRIEAYRRAVLERDGHSKNIGNDVYLTVNEAAVLAGVNPETVHKWIKKEKVEAVQSSKTIRIPRQEFEGWLQGREKVEV